MLLLSAGKHLLLCVPKPGNPFLCTGSSLARMSRTSGKILELSLWPCPVVLASCTPFRWDCVSSFFEQCLSLWLQ